tara:strand:- start:66 stop:227 length:162 start_codon:yes stop_codon:yes gene_type:complete
MLDAHILNEYLCFVRHAAHNNRTTAGKNDMNQTTEALNAVLIFSLVVFLWVVA